MGCKKFRAWIRDFNMQDMGFIGHIYTWKKGMFQERLDRFVCNEEWKGWFANFRVVHLPRIMSDHCPIMLQIEGQRKVNNQRPPKFLAAREIHSLWARFVKDQWNTQVGFMEALNEFRSKAQVWNKEVFGSVLARKKKG